MRVPERDLLRAVPNSLSDLKGAETAVNEKRYMRVAKVMHPDLFHPCLFASGLHRRIKAVFGQGEDAVILLDVIELFQTVLHLLAQNFGILMVRLLYFVFVVWITSRFPILWKFLSIRRVCFSKSKSTGVRASSSPSRIPHQYSTSKA